MTTVKEAAKILLSVCDGAKTKDAQGYTGVDSEFIRDVLSKNYFTYNQEIVVHKILIKYKKQLLNSFNINYDELTFQNSQEVIKISPSNFDNQKIIMPFGKYKGMTLDQVFQNDPNYIRWIAKEFDAGYIKECAQKLINHQPIEKETLQLSLKNGKILIKSPFSYKDKIKELPERHWNPDLKVWECPLSVLRTITTTFPEAILTDEIKNELNKMISISELSNKSHDDNINIKFGDLELLPFQSVGVKFIENAGGRALVADEMGCIDGNTLISLNRNGKGFKLKLSDLYLRFNNLDNRKRYKWNLNEPTYARSLMPDGTIKLNQILNVINKGIKNTIKISTIDKKLILTPDHEILTPNGFITAEKLKIGDKILTNGNLICPNCGSTNDIIIYKNFPLPIPKEDIITNIEYIGERCVYDIIMSEPARNFIANGIIVHNCGKTIQALGYIRIHPEIRPVLIVCPASLKLNWKKEAEKWLESKDQVSIINGQIECDKSVYIINYDILIKHEKELINMGFKLVILDESHYLKNQKARRTAVTINISKNIPNRILLTGTPVLNRPKELFTQLNIIDPIAYPKFTTFAFRYCNPEKNDYGWDFNGASHIEELNDRLKTTMIRRTKEQVLKELPDKRRQTIIMTLSNKKEYEKAHNDFTKWLKENMNKTVDAEHLVRIEMLKQLSVKGKMPAIIENINNFIESDKKLVIFAHHKIVIDQLMTEFKDIAVSLTGETSMENRQKAVDDFMNNPTKKLFIGNLQAAGVGITLTSSSDVMFIEFPWTPSQLQQAEDRLHRIGQKNAVNVMYMVGEKSIDEDIIDLLEKKSKVIDAVIDGKESSNLNIMTDLITKFL